MIYSTDFHNYASRSTLCDQFNNAQKPKKFPAEIHREPVSPQEQIFRYGLPLALWRPEHFGRLGLIRSSRLVGILGLSCSIRLVLLRLAFFRLSFVAAFLLHYLDPLFLRSRFSLLDRFRSKVTLCAFLVLNGYLIPSLQTGQGFFVRDGKT